MTFTLIDSLFFSFQTNTKKGVITKVSRSLARSESCRKNVSSKFIAMINNPNELAQHCIDTHEFETVKISNRYLLFHQNAVDHSSSQQLPSTVIRKIFGSVGDVRRTPNVDPSLYDIIIFADKSAVYTRKRTLNNGTDEEHHLKKSRILPYYVQEDLQLLAKAGISKEDIDLFVQKLDAKESTNSVNWNQYDKIIQKIIDSTDISTRLKCRQVSKKWKNFVDRSASWNDVKLSKLRRHLDRALDYFQKIDIRELNLSESFLEPLSYEFKHEFYVYSLRSLSISTDHPLEFFPVLFKIAPFLQYIRLVQSSDHSSSELSTTNQLYQCVQFVICQCQERFKCLRRLHIQLRSISDQIFLQSSSISSIPISFEVLTR